MREWRRDWVQPEAVCIALDGFLRSVDGDVDILLGGFVRCSGDVSSLKGLPPLNRFIPSSVPLHSVKGRADLLTRVRRDAVWWLAAEAFTNSTLTACGRSRTPNKRVAALSIVVSGCREALLSYNSSLEPTYLLRATLGMFGPHVGVLVHNTLGIPISSHGALYPLNLKTGNPNEIRVANRRVRLVRAAQKHELDISWQRSFATDTRYSSQAGLRKLFSIEQHRYYLSAFH